MQLHYDRVRRRYWPRHIGLAAYLLLIALITLLFLILSGIGQGN